MTTTLITPPRIRVPHSATRLFTAADLAGITGMSIPCGFTADGLQLLSPAFDEAKMVRIGRMYEGVTDWHTKRVGV